jgi:hypothetical protein
MNLGPKGELLLADPEPLPMLSHVGAESRPELIGWWERLFPTEAHAFPFRSPDADDEVGSTSTLNSPSISKASREGVGGRPRRRFRRSTRGDGGGRRRRCSATGQDRRRSPPGTPFRSARPEAAGRP